MVPTAAGGWVDVGGPATWKLAILETMRAIRRKYSSDADKRDESGEFGRGVQPRAITAG
jgi:hypothetical protein